MAERMSAQLANKLATVLADTFSDGLLELYGGSFVSPGDMTGGTLLCQVLLPAVAFKVAADGAIIKDGQWFGTVGASGTVAFGRFANRANDMHLMVRVSLPGAGGELQLDNLSATLGGVVDVTSFAYVVPTGG